MRRLRKRYGHAHVSRVMSLFKKAERQDAQAARVATRRAGAEHRMDKTHQRFIGAEQKLKRQIAGLKAKEADLKNEASANRALAKALEKK